MSDNTLYSSAIVPATPGPAPAANRKNQPYTPGLNYLDIRIPDINDPTQQGQVEGLKKFIATMTTLVPNPQSRPIPTDFSNPDTCLIVKGSGNKVRKIKSVNPLPHSQWAAKRVVAKFSNRLELDPAAHEVYSSDEDTSGDHDGDGDGDGDEDGDGDKDGDANIQHPAPNANTPAPSKSEVKAKLAEDLAMTAEHAAVRAARAAEELRREESEQARDHAANWSRGMKI